MRFTFILALAVFLGFSSLAHAATIWVGLEDIALPAGDRDYNDAIVAFSGPGLVVLGQGAWRPMAAPAEDGIEFWDSTSWDGPYQGVAYHLPQADRYWGIGTDPDPAFVLRAVGAVSVTLLSEESAWQDLSALYWVNAGGAHALFTGSDNVGAETSFRPGGDFSLQWRTPGGDFSSLGQGDQFALFKYNPEPGGLFLLAGGLAALGAYRMRRRREP